MPIIFDRPVDGDSDFAGKRQPFERPPAKPVSEILGIQALIVNQPGEPFNRGFLIPLCASQFGLIAGLLFNDRSTKVAMDLTWWPCVQGSNSLIYSLTRVVR